MAYSDNREQMKEMKYLRKVLGEVDAGIPIPNSVRGAALRHKLDNITPQAPPAPNTRGGVTFGLRWFNLHSGLTYAAAFALIVGLFYGLGFNQQPQIVRQPEPASQNETIPGSQQPDVPQISAATTSLPETADPVLPDAPVTEGSTPPSQASQPSQPRAGQNPTPAVGGGGQAEVLGQQGGYTYTWRSNDATDPDKGAYPVTMEIVQDNAGQVVCQIDIDLFDTIADSYLTATTISLVGTSEGRIVTVNYNIEDPQEPVEQAVLSQPGSYLGSRLYKELLHVASYSGNSQDITCEIEPLPYSVSESACIMSALDTATGESKQKAFQGASQDVSIFDIRAYIYYRGVAETEEGQTENTDAPPEDASQNVQEDAAVLHVAQIQLDDLNLSISSVS